MRTTLDIDADLLQAAKEIGAGQGKTAGQIVSELLRKALTAPAAPGGMRNGVPLIARRPGAPLLTMAFVNGLRDDE
ncbi:MAG TPA: hypothetical protein VNJ04_14985 [Gemmatimonadaceae bacterium]|nr:hypothetical protein [Gemmatimonadaceae bacterium]